MALDLTSVRDFADKAAETIGKYKVEFTLSPEQLQTNPFAVSPLSWDSIPYGEDELDRVPDDKRGIYAFAVCHPSEVLPSHGYVLYIGIAGKRSGRSLRARYKDYLNAKKILKRNRIARMIGHWQTVLRFYFAPVDDDVDSDTLEQLEKELNGALLPPFSEGDLEAEIKAVRRAFS